MNPATGPRSASARRLLVARARASTVEERPAPALAALLREGDLLVVNDAATLPASLTTLDGAVEVRLAGPPSSDVVEAVAFGRGSFRQRTEDRPGAGLVGGETLRFGGGLEARVESVDGTGRRVTLRLSRAGAGPLFSAGAPVQYSYLNAPLDLWDVQTLYASRPWAVEAPSAGFCLDFAALRSLRTRGVAIAALTHAAGLSSTGDTSLDATLPWPERYELPARTVAEIEKAKARGGRVIAVGTSVVRALESVAAENAGRLVAGAGVTRLRIGPGHERRVVDGLLSGVHVPGESHEELFGAFAGDALRRLIREEGEARGFLLHEFGDGCLLLP